MTPDLKSYDHIIVYFSGGKDSLACLLHLIDQGVDLSRVELWHHEIDARDRAFMDWPVTPAYCKAVADHFGIPILFSWKEGGFRREMFRHNARTAPITFELPDNSFKTVGGTGGKENTREQYPQVSANLSVRWCSAYLKIDVASAAIRNDPRFLNKRVLVISGEAAYESHARENYEEFEPDRTDNRNGKRNVRHVDRWRPIHKWTEVQIWDIMKRYSIRPHYAYILGWGRVSCMFCIFGSDDQWASAAVVDPEGTEEHAQNEELFGKTIHRKLSIRERIKRGKAYEMDPEIIRRAKSDEYTESIIVDVWELPKGAYGDLSGPC